MKKIACISALVVVRMTQSQPGQRRGEDRDLFRQLVQASIID